MPTSSHIPTMNIPNYSAVPKLVFPQTPPSSSTTMPRTRADSLGSISLPGPPANTPDTQSLLGDQASINFDSVDDDLVKETNIRLGQPTFVPENTPVSSTPAPSTPGSYRKPRRRELPKIDEVIELLPPRSASSKISSYSTHSIFDLTSAAQPPSSPPAIPVSPLVPGYSGVREHSDWAVDIEQDLDRDLTRLANLAEDDHQRDPSQSAEKHYQGRLGRLLKEHPFPFTRVDSAVTLKTSEPEMLEMVPASEFEQIKRQVEILTALVNSIVTTQTEEDHQITILRQGLEKLLKKEQAPKARSAL